MAPSRRSRPRLARPRRRAADAVAGRVRARLGLGAADALLTDLVAETSRLWRTAQALRAASDAHETHVTAARERLAWLEAHRVEVDRQLEDLHARQRLVAEEARAAGDQARRATVARDLLALGAWVAHLPPQPARVAVITATRDRAHVLGRALASVEAQTHTTWQHVVVDDGSRDGTPELLAAIDDPRVKVVTLEGGGNPAALNAGLAAVDDDVEVITYLDDDNVMLPDWLTAVAWAIRARPDVDVLYGGRVIEADYPWPFIQAEPYDRSLLEQMCFMDQNVLAHRPAIGVRYDEGLRHGADWEMALRLTEQHTPLLLPVLAVLYSTTGEGRLTDEASEPATMELIVQRMLARQPSSR